MSAAMVSNFNFNLNFNNGPIGQSWGQEFGGGCHRVLGGPAPMTAQALLGGLLGSLLCGGGNPLGNILGGLLGGLIGGTLGQHMNGNQAFGPSFGGGCGLPGGFAGGFGGFGCPSPAGQGAYGQPHWGGGPNINFNFNFGHHCPPSQCCRQPGPRPRDGQLRQEQEGKPVEYTTSGGYKIRVDKHDIFITDPAGKNTVKHHGDPHEDLNGKHIKDWQGKQRTVVLGDGTKITMTADGPQGVTQGTSIYDGRQNIQITNASNKVTHHSFNSLDTLLRDLRQHDGETASFKTSCNGTGIYNNVYNEDSDFKITRLYQKLARGNGSAVEDLFDDPNLAHT